MKEVKTIKDTLEELNITPKYKKLDQDTAINIITLLSMVSSGQITEKSILEVLHTDSKYFLLQVFWKRIEALNLADKVSSTVLIGIDLLEISTPAESVIAVIDIVAYVEKNNITQVTLEELFMCIYPDGFYDKETVVKIIDNVLKPKRCTFSEIY